VSPVPDARALTFGKRDRPRRQESVSVRRRGAGTRAGSPPTWAMRPMLGCSVESTGVSITMRETLRRHDLFGGRQ